MQCAMDTLVGGDEQIAAGGWTNSKSQDSTFNSNNIKKQQQIIHIKPSTTYVQICFGRLKYDTTATECMGMCICAFMFMIEWLKKYLFDMQFQLLFRKREKKTT